MCYMVNIRKQKTIYHHDPSAAKQLSRNKTQGFEKQHKTHTSPLYSVFLFAVVHCTEELKVSRKSNLQRAEQKMSGQKDILKYAKNKRSFAMMLAHNHQWKNMMKRRVFLFPLGRTKAIEYNTVFIANDSMMDNQL